jgi:hypothetical protein
MVSENRGFPEMRFFKVTSFTKCKAWLRFTKLIVNIHVHN